jgi:hypothetical protein
MHKHKPKVGNAVQFYTDADADPQPALVTCAYGDARNCVCLVAWCSIKKAFFEHISIPHMASDNLDGPYWACPDETDEVD